MKRLVGVLQIKLVGEGLKIEDYSSQIVGLLGMMKKSLKRKPKLRGKEWKGVRGVQE